MVRHCWRVWPGECAGSAACCVSVKAGHVFPLMGRSRVNKQSNCKPSHSPPPATCQQSHQPTRHVYMASTCTDINIHILLYYLSYKAKALDVLFNENTLEYRLYGVIQDVVFTHQPHFSCSLLSLICLSTNQNIQLIHSLLIRTEWTTGNGILMSSSHWPIYDKFPPAHNQTSEADKAE